MTTSAAPTTAGRREWIGLGVLSVLAAFSASNGMLIANRALLGIAGAPIAPSTLSLMFGMFTDPRQRATAVAVADAPAETLAPPPGQPPAGAGAPCPVGCA